MVISPRGNCRKSAVSQNLEGVIERKLLIYWRSLRDSNPSYSLERPAALRRRSRRSDIRSVGHVSCLCVSAWIYYWIYLFGTFIVTATTQKPPLINYLPPTHTRAIPRATHL